MSTVHNPFGALAPSTASSSNFSSKESSVPTIRQENTDRDLDQRESVISSSETRDQLMDLRELSKGVASMKVGFNVKNAPKSPAFQKLSKEDLAKKNKDAGALSRDNRTISYQSTAAPSGMSSAASVCSASPQNESTDTVGVEAEGTTTWQDAIWHPEIPVRGPELECNPLWVKWIEQVVDCSMIAFENDCCELVSKKSKFKLGVLTTPDNEFLGFSVYKVNRGQGNLTIAKIAVPEEQRHHGYGKRLVKEMIKIAKKDKMIYFVSLSSLPTAVRFYKRMNFKEFKDVKFTGVTIEEGESFVEGQVYMEFKVRNEPKTKKRK